MSCERAKYGLPTSASADAGPPSSAAGTGELVAVDNLPAEIPIAAREFDALETYLADLLDLLLDEAVGGSADAGG